MEYNKICGKDSIRYAGTQRICSRLGDRTFSLDCSASLTPQTQQRLGTRIMKVDQRARAELLEVVEAGDVPVEFPNVLNLITLLPAGSNANSHSHSNPNTDIFYYHTNHLGSTAFVTDANATITQGFLYAPFGEIIDEYNATFANGVIPKYTFNAKELDEETGMYYYEARYMAPPTFISRDPLFEKYFWMSPYAYCANNPMKYVDPTGCEMTPPYPNSPLLWASLATVAKFSSSAKVKTAIYAMQHPINAARIGTADLPTWGISKIASNFEVNLRNGAGFSSGEGKQGNAYRHALWQSMLTNEFGADQAACIGNAHEDNLPSDMNQRNFNNMGVADQMADLLNNVIGREIGEKNKGASNRKLSEAVLNEYRQNGLWTVSGDSKTGYKVQKTRLSQEQYNNALKILQTKGENGLNQ